jgi:hypothetical protein
MRPLSLIVSASLLLTVVGTAAAQDCAQLCARAPTADSCKAQCRSRAEKNAKDKASLARAISDCNMGCESQTKDCRAMCEAAMRNRDNPGAMRSEQKAILDRRMNAGAPDNGRKP